MPGFFVPFAELLTFFTLHAKDKFTISRNEIYFKEGIMKKISLLIMMSMVSALMAPPKKTHLSSRELAAARRLSTRPGGMPPGDKTIRAARTVIAVEDATRKGHERKRSASETDLEGVAASASGAAAQIKRDPKDQARRDALEALRKSLKKPSALTALLAYQTAQAEYDEDVALAMQRLRVDCDRFRAERDRLQEENDALKQAAAASAAARQSESDARFARMEQTLQQMAALLRAQSAGAAAAPSPYGELPPPPPLDNPDPLIPPPPPAGNDS